MNTKFSFLILLTFTSPVPHFWIMTCSHRPQAKIKTLKASGGPGVIPPFRVMGSGRYEELMPGAQSAFTYG